MQQVKPQHISSLQDGHSLLFDGGIRPYLESTSAQQPLLNGQKWTFSFWIKGAFPTGTAFPSGGSYVYDMGGQYNGPNGTIAGSGIKFFEDRSMSIGNDTKQENGFTTHASFEGRAVRFSDPSAWYHIFITFDSTDGTEKDRLRIYVNGKRIDWEYDYGVIAVNQGTGFLRPFGSNIARIGASAENSWSYPLYGYLAEFYALSDTVAEASEFGREDSNGVWNPIPYEGEYGNNGFYFPFEADDLGKDHSGNGNDFTSNGFTSYAVVADGPMNNYCTMNPIAQTGVDISNGNLTVNSGQAKTTFHGVFGKWYYEKDGVGVLRDGQPDYMSPGVYNFGQRSFVGSVPAGYKTLCTNNLPNPSGKPKDNFSANTWSGNTQANPIETGFQPGLVWVKRRDTVSANYLVDTVRGRTRALSSNAASVEEAKASGIVSWDDNGFATGSDTGFSGTEMVGWSFKAGETVTNNVGEIPSQVSVNNDLGFSIVEWTGNGVNSNVGHGLGVVPSLLISKSIETAHSWAVQSEPCWVSSSQPNILYLDSDAVASQDTNIFQVYPTSALFYPEGGYWPGIGELGKRYITYCFTNTDMLQVGRYDGNGVADGPFVSLPFKPAMVMLKRMSGSANDWYIYDNARDPYNSVGYELYPNLPDGESVHYDDVDFVSNGFKITSAGGGENAASPYLFLAISEQNFKYSRGR